jgi:DNA-binding GntR family transcriptional regulator
MGYEAENEARKKAFADWCVDAEMNRHHSLFKQGRLSDSLAEHRALMAAIDARDAERARALMRAHFEHGLEAAA